MASATTSNTNTETTNHKYHDIGGRDLEESILNALKLKNNIDVKYRFSIARQLFTETTNLFEEQ